MDQNETFKAVESILKDCTDEELNSCAVVIGYDYETQVVRIYGLNIEEWEVPDLLHDAAVTTGYYVDQRMANRTLN
jgi:hypothetical protein